MYRKCIGRNRHLSKKILETDGIYVCPNWLGIDINGQNPNLGIAVIIGDFYCDAVETFKLFFMTSEISTEVCSDVAWSGVLHSA